jgi:hypothetical protein
MMRRFTKTNILSAFVAFVIGLVAFLLVVREPTVPLTAEGLSDARWRWREAAVRDYEIRYRMQTSEFAVRVRGGTVIEATVDGRPVTSADLGSYGVEGLFDVLELDLENLSGPNGPFAGQFGNVIVRVRFHETLGYVERYLRSGGMGRGASIELVEFRRNGE